MSLIFLIGMPGAGKSYIGENLAMKYGLNLVDLDLYIEKQKNTSIPALFSFYGEKGFREIERACLNVIIKNTKGNTVIACGGGTPCFFDNMEVIKKAGTVVYLKADLKWLSANLKKAHTRPLFTGASETDIEKKLQELVQKRYEIYEQAHHILPAENLTVSTFEEIISSCIKGH